MDKLYWKNNVRNYVLEVLNEVDEYKNKEFCFLSAYQIAILTCEKNNELLKDYKIGGKGEGYSTLAQWIAWHLSRDDSINKNIEKRFLSTNKIEIFLFNEINIPSIPEFSMFRLINKQI